MDVFIISRQARFDLIVCNDMRMLTWASWDHIQAAISSKISNDIQEGAFRQCFASAKLQLSQI